MKTTMTIALAVMGVVTGAAAASAQDYYGRRSGAMVYGYTEYAPGYEPDGYVTYERREPRRYQDPGAFGLKDNSNPNRSLRTQADREVFWDSIQQRE